jgi:hypothetical protein
MRMTTWTTLPALLLAVGVCGLSANAAAETYDQCMAQWRRMDEMNVPGRASFSQINGYCLEKTSGRRPIVQPTVRSVREQRPDPMEQTRRRLEKERLEYQLEQIERARRAAAREDYRSRGGVPGVCPSLNALLNPNHACHH